LYQATATVARGWALIEHSQDEAIEQLRQGLAAHRATGTELLVPHFLALLAEAWANGRQIDKGLRVLEEALTVIHHHGERYYEAELYRLKGELLLKAVEINPHAVTNAKACFDQAIRIAQQQKAKSLELRAAMSVARLCQSQGRLKEAREPLASIYERFTEGFDTRDLRDAKVLLDELAYKSLIVDTSGNRRSRAQSGQSAR